jgi:molybdenum cofactor biosynthesis enzyme MoaA
MKKNGGTVMEKLEIKRKILVKAVVTEKFKNDLIKELQEGIQKLEAELQFIEQRTKKTITELTLKGSPQVASYKEQIEYEKMQREAAKEKMTEQIKFVSSLELGKEVVQGEVEGPVVIQVGDNWEEITKKEIVLEDGKIIAIR